MRKEIDCINCFMLVSEVDVFICGLLIDDGDFFVGERVV